MTEFYYRNTKAAKVTVSQVLEIRARARRGETYSSIARDYEVNALQVGRIVRKESWAQVGEPELTQEEVQEQVGRLMRLQEQVRREQEARAEREGRGERLLGELEHQPSLAHHSSLPVSPEVAARAVELGARPHAEPPREESRAKPREQRYDDAGYPVEGDET